MKKYVLRVAFFLITMGSLILPSNLIYAQTTSTSQDLFKSWFEGNCNAGEKPLFQAIREKGQELGPLFIQAYEKGPDAKWIQERVNSEMALVRKNQDYIKKNDGKVPGLSEEDVKAIETMDLGAYEAGLRKNLETSYKRTALIGLSNTRSLEAREYLTKLSKNQRLDDSPLATKLLKQMSQ